MIGHRVTLREAIAAVEGRTCYLRPSRDFNATAFLVFA